MIRHLVLISCTIDNSWDCISSYHPSIHPSLHLALYLENCSSVHPSSLRPSFRPFISILIKKSHKAPMLDFTSSTSSSVYPSNPPTMLHLFIFCGWVDVHYLSIIIHETQHTAAPLYMLGPLFICHIVHIHLRFPADVRSSTRSKSLFIFLHLYFSSTFPAVSQLGTLFHLPVVQELRLEEDLTVCVKKYFFIWAASLQAVNKQHQFFIDYV